VRGVTLAMLAGGRGTRMGGPKGALSLAGEPILAHLMRRIAWRGPSLLVLSPGIERPAGAELFQTVTHDPVAGEGPLRGVLTALDASTTGVVVVATVDMPGVTRAALEHLVSNLGESVALMLSRAVNGRDVIEPFPSAFRSGARECVSRRLAEGRRAVQGLAGEPGVAVGPAPAWDERVWTNLNYPADLDAFERDARD
jgi:molybdopterin-guanine dinucleotide biosynthesis protein A